MNRRQWAKGKPCQIRIPGVCNFNPETSVLCHYRMPGLTGIAQKADDRYAAIGCSDCHDHVDFRVQTDQWTRDELKLMHLEGMIRTDLLWRKE